MSVIIIICVTSMISALTAGVIVSNNYGLSYQELANDKELNDFLKAYANIVDNYYEDIDKAKMLDSALNAMLNYLGDNYTTYLNSDEKKDLEARLSGSYEGIGVTISGRMIKEIAENSPAQKAGLQVGDLFVSVNGKNVTEENSAIISNLIKNSGKKEANITIFRNGENLDFTVPIEKIATIAVNHKMLENNIGYMQMTIFSRNLTEQVKKALIELEGQGMQKLIIDLRDNTGGYLDSANSTASLFLEKGKLIYSLQDKDKKEEYKDETDESRNYPIVILLNKNSASAAEILAAALKDSYNAVIVGETSFGKGKVQQTYNLEDGSMAKYTSAKWLRPNGDCIDQKGIKPDYEASLTYTYDEEGNETSTIDSQLTKAVEVIGAM